jgi:hypothetical protein
VYRDFTLSIPIAVNCCSFIPPLVFCPVDKFHFKKNHVGRWCLKNTNPYAYKELEDANMSICEQRFKWWGGFKRSLR